MKTTIIIALFILLQGCSTRVSLTSSNGEISCQHKQQECLSICKEDGLTQSCAQQCQVESICEMTPNPEVY
ncbi:hypothetical protein [Pseudoalteromonas luteoviolacea]|uniref:Lipoprotein n=1 Tax=Pseudoalteromonas luteoviolacea H33 TaxID=1365251 RepID=A0A167G3J8_9GAMM|nr:hypothetical protein [Pseudoalteromonas luteoviolacea]KZN54070.1 hypothetical protein N476_07720 [Pseudoalteromonas luteoviolacea H33]KZN78399.1 hypothetical protein N477_09805 [Pseudoalteromonas luteoviolacea H33-S]MBQ4877353.1 hypothetical protein [Pseudoalteromonas luteoviolacea]MBQ4906548.1 hypothetical protein [Pseudoalteromonas luteoviolacea]